MVRFAPHVAPLLRVREQIPLADEYRVGCRDRLDHTFWPPDACRPAPDGPDAPDAGPVPVPVPVPAPVPEPFDDADALEELEDEIATLAAHIHAATH